MQVVTDDTHYKNIADEIRLNTGSTETYKPEDMWLGVNRVYGHAHTQGDKEGYARGLAEGIDQGKQAEHDRFWDDVQMGGIPMNCRRMFDSSPFTENICNPKYDFVCTNCNGMFAYIGYSNVVEGTITDLKAHLQKIGKTLDTSQSKSLQEMFYTNKAFTHIPTISAESTTDLNSTFAGSVIVALHLILKEDGTNTFSFATSYQQTFYNCATLKELAIEGVIGNSVNFQYSPLILASATNVLNALKNYAGTDKEGANRVVFSGTTKKYLNEAGAVFNGMTWEDYLLSIGWTT